MSGHDSQSRAALNQHVGRLLECATRGSGVPGRIARQAAVATLRRFAAVEFPPASEWEGRVEAYFWGAVRGCAFRAPRHAAGELRRRLVAASIAADLRESGMPEELVLEEVVRTVGVMPGPAPGAMCA
jgi:hypothetical protein